MRLFNFGRNCRLSIVPIVDDNDKVIYHWLSGRLFGFYISITTLPTFKVKYVGKVKEV